MIFVLTLGALFLAAASIPAFGLLLITTGEFSFTGPLQSAFAITATIANLSFVVIGALFAVGWIG